MTAHYRPGDRTAAVAGGRIVVSSDPAVVLDLWPTLQSGGDLVDALLRRAAGEPADLVIVDRSGPDLVVLVRGELPVVVEPVGSAPQTLDARKLRTWVERHVPLGTRVTVGVPQGESADLPILAGVVPMSSLVLEGVPDPLAGPVPVAVPPEVKPQVAPADRADVPSVVRAVPGTAKGKDTLAGPVETDLEHLFDHTVSRPIEAAAVRDEPAHPEQPAPVPSTALGDHDGTTITAAELAGLIGRHAASGDPDDSRPRTGTERRGPSSEPTYRIGQEVTVVLSTGRQLPLSGPIVIGRQPRVDRWSGPIAPTLVTVPADRESDISRTHLRIERLDGRVMVTDLNAANGSVVIRATGEIDLRDGATLEIGPADQVLIGDGVSVSLRVGP